MENFALEVSLRRAPANRRFRKNPSAAPIIEWRIVE